MIEKVLVPTALIMGMSPAIQIKSIEKEIKYNSDSYKESACYTKEETQAKVYSIISDKLGKTHDDIKPTSRFEQDLGADSLDTVFLILEFEKEFKISIPDDLAEKMLKVGDVLDFIYEQYKTAVAIFSAENFEGSKKCIIDKATEYDNKTVNHSLIEDGLSSIIIPSGIIVTLFTEKDYMGETMRITAKDNRIEINKISNLRNYKNIEVSNKKVNWNKNVKSIIIEKIK